MIKVKFEWTNYREWDYERGIVKKTHEDIPDQEFNTEKEMLDFALNKHPTIIVSNWIFDEQHYGACSTLTNTEKQYDYEIELYNGYRE